MIERIYGKEIFLEEAHKSIMDALYRDALKQEELVPVGEPDVEMTQADPVAFTVTVAVYPTIDAGDYASVRVRADGRLGHGRAGRRGHRADAQERQPVGRRRSAAANPRTAIRSRSISRSPTEDGEPFQEPLTDSVFIIGESQLFEPLKDAIVDLTSARRPMSPSPLTRTTNPPPNACAVRPSPTR